jgi:hypothetical protein
MHIDRSIDANGCAALKRIELPPQLGRYQIIYVKPRVVNSFNEVCGREHS